MAEQRTKRKKFVTKDEIGKLIEEFNKALFCIDVMIEVMCEHYIKVDKQEFQKYVDECAKARIENANKENNLEKKEE